MGSHNPRINEVKEWTLRLTSRLKAYVIAGSIIMVAVLWVNLPGGCGASEEKAITPGATDDAQDQCPTNVIQAACPVRGSGGEVSIGNVVECKKGSPSTDFVEKNNAKAVYCVTCQTGIRSGGVLVDSVNHPRLVIISESGAISVMSPGSIMISLVRAGVKMDQADKDGRRQWNELWDQTCQSRRDKGE
jgi:hypothetical protein